MGQLSVDLSATDHVPAGEPVRTAADTVLTTVEDVQGTVQQLGDDWAVLPVIYAGTDHDETLYAAFSDPETDIDGVVEMASGLKGAAHAAADEFDAIRTARDTILTVDLPAAQTQYERAVEQLGDDATQTDRAVLKAQHEEPLRISADALLTRLQEAEDAFSSAVATAMGLRPDRSVRSNFAYGTHDPMVVEAQELHGAATAPGATAEDLAAYYEHLATLSPEQIEALGAVGPDLRTTPPPLPTTEEDLAEWPGGAEGSAWWQGLTSEQQAALVLALPALVGNTEGVPYTDRSAANTRTLNLLENDPDLSEDHRTDLQAIREALANPQEGPRSLLSLRHADGQEHVLAALAIGTADTADTVTWRVPGMGAESNGAPAMMNEMQHLYNETSGNRAVVLWIGYNTPDGAHHAETAGSSQVLSNDLAYQGAIPLAHALDGFQESRRANADFVAQTQGVGSPPATDPRFNVAAHSYGTPTAAYALTMTEHEVDSYVMYGSVGVDPDRVPDAEALNVARDAEGNPEVYATQARGDHIAVPLGQTLSPFGGQQRISPTDDVWGAKVFSSDGATGPGNAATTSHMGYVEGVGVGYTEPGSQSLNSIASILDGRGHEVELIDQSWWDELTDRPGATLLEEPNAAVDGYQQDARSWVESEQQGANESIDDWQERHSWVPSAPVDWLQHGGNRLVDGAQNGADGLVDAAQEGTEDLVDAGAEWVSEQWPKVIPHGERLYEAFEEGGLPTFVDRTLDGWQEDVRESVDVRQDGVNNAVDDWQQNWYVPDAPVDWLQDRGNESVDTLQDGVGDWVDEQQVRFREKLAEWL